MFALMKPSSVATRSSTRGTSRGCTVVTETSGEFGATCAGLREQLVLNDTATNVAAPIAATVNKRRRCMEWLGAVGATCAGLREQLVLNDTATNVAATIDHTAYKRRRCMESLVGVSLREN